MRNLVDLPKINPEMLKIFINDKLYKVSEITIKVNNFSNNPSEAFYRYVPNWKDYTHWARCVLLLKFPPFPRARMVRRNILTMLTPPTYNMEVSFTIHFDTPKDYAAFYYENLDHYATHYTGEVMLSSAFFTIEKYFIKEYYKDNRKGNNDFDIKIILQSQIKFVK